MGWISLGQAQSWIAEKDNQEETFAIFGYLMRMEEIRMLGRLKLGIVEKT